MSTHFYLNRNDSKSSYDRITIRKDGAQCIVDYMDSLTTTEKTKTPHTMTYSITDFYQYVTTVLDFLQSDADTIPYVSIDVQIPGYPSVCLKPNDTTKDIVLRAVYSWVLH